MKDKLLNYLWFCIRNEPNEKVRSFINDLMNKLNDKESILYTDPKMIKLELLTNEEQSDSSDKISSRFTLEDVRKKIEQSNDKIERLYKPSLFLRIMNKLGLKS